MKTLTIDGDSHIVSDDVAELIILISHERDDLRDEHEAEKTAEFKLDNRLVLQQICKDATRQATGIVYNGCFRGAWLELAHAADRLDAMLFRSRVGADMEIGDS